MKLNKYVQIAFALTGLIGWMLAAGFVEFGFDVTSPDANLMLLGEQFRLADLIGLVAGFGLWMWLRLNARINEFGREVVSELGKVSWPGLKEVKTSTVVVIITSLVVAALLGLFDYVWGVLTSYIYKA